MEVEQVSKQDQSLEGCSTLLVTILAKFPRLIGTGVARGSNHIVEE